MPSTRVVSVAEKARLASCCRNSRSSPWPASSHAKTRPRRRLRQRNGPSARRHRLTPAIIAGNDLAFVWSGPNQWLALGPQSAEAVEARLGAVFGTHASVFDQSGSRVLLELRGSRVRDVLAKGMSIDLHPRAFKTGDVAVTTASHLAVHLWQVADEPVYRLLVVRTWFDSLWRWLAASAAEYGCEVLVPASYASHTP